MMGSSLCGHVEDGRCLARVIDNDVVDIVVLYCGTKDRLSNLIGGVKRF